MRLRILQPRIVERAARELPQVVVRIDNGNVVSAHRA